MTVSKINFWRPFFIREIIFPLTCVSLWDKNLPLYLNWHRYSEKITSIRDIIQYLWEWTTPVKIQVSYTHARTNTNHHSAFLWKLKNALLWSQLKLCSGMGAMIFDVAVSCGYDTQSAVRLVMGYTISLFTWSFWGNIWIPHDQVSPSQAHRCPGVSGSHQSDHVVTFWHLSYPTYRCTWVVLWLLCFRSAPSTFPDTWSTFKGPLRGVPSH